MKSRQIFMILASLLLLAAGCPPPPDSSPRIPVRPMCTVQMVVQNTNLISWNGRVFVADRNDPNVLGNFSPFRAARGPIGNPGIPFTNSSGIPDVYGFSETWLRPAYTFDEVYRAQLTPALRQGIAGPDFFGGEWHVNIQDASGSWTGRILGATLGRSSDPVEPGEWAVAAAPRLMSVGDVRPRMFASVLGRTEDDAENTTWLVDVTRGFVTFVQDLLNGDDRFVPNRPGPLIGPATPPTPSVRGPGEPVRSGSVACAMTQVRDDTTTRALHMLALKGGKIFHALATDWGSVTQVGRIFNRFRSVSGWGDVLQVLGGNFGEVSSIAIVGQTFGTSVHVFFVAKANNQYRLWHTGRLPSGAWRQPVDVFAASGETQTGWGEAFKVAAGTCPTIGENIWDERNTEILIAIYGSSFRPVYTISYVSPPREWVPGRNPSNYSNWSLIRNGEWDPSFVINGVYVTVRPFSDMATP